MAQLSLKLFHGRNTPYEQLDDWGFDGPALGPFERVQFTYGTFTVHTAEDEIQLTTVNELLFYDGKFYGDATVCLASETPPDEQVDERKTICSQYETVRDVPPVSLGKGDYEDYLACVQVFVDAVIERTNERAASRCAEVLRRVVQSRVT